MAVILQQRIYELDTYTQVNPGDDGYEDPNTLYYAIDKVGWTKPRRVVAAPPTGTGVSLGHMEAGEEAGSGAYSHDWQLAFANTEYFCMVQAYKEETMDLGAGDVTVITNVPFHSFAKTESGFTLTLSESATVKYFAVE